MRPARATDALIERIKAVSDEIATAAQAVTSRTDYLEGLLRQLAAELDEEEEESDDRTG